VIKLNGFNILALSLTQWCSVWSHCIAVVQEMFDRWEGGGGIGTVVNRKNLKWHVMPKRGVGFMSPSMLNANLRPWLDVIMMTSLMNK